MARINYILLRQWGWWWCFICTNTQRWIFIVLTQVIQQSTGRYVTPLWHIILTPSYHSDTLSWLQACQSLLLLLNAAWLAKKQEIPNLIVFGLTGLRFKPTIYHTREEHTTIQEKNTPPYKRRTHYHTREEHTTIQEKNTLPYKRKTHNHTRKEHTTIQEKKTTI